MSASVASFKSRLDRKLYNREEFKKAPIVDKVFMHLVAGPTSIFELNEREGEYLMLMEEAYTLLKEHMSPAIARKMLVARISDLTHRRYSAIQVLHDAQQLFGRFEAVHKPVQRGIIRERMVARIKYCEEQMKGCEDKEAPAWEKLIQTYYVELAKLDKLAEVDEVAADTSLPKVFFTNDPEALKEETEDIDHEEL